MRRNEFFCYKGGINLKRGVAVEIGGLPLFLLLYSSITFTACGGKVRFPLLLFVSSVFSVSAAKILIQVFTVLKPGIVYTFLIHSGSLQKILTALFNLVWNAEQSKWTIIFECQGKIFLSIGKFLEKISEDQP